MELKRVEIVGFKSFPEKIRVEFDKGITAIVGPNGSGKSNIADAVRWVLGEQSAKSLRGSKMEDVIFAGTERRRPVGFAEVTLVLDNRDKKMAVDYDEVQVRRRLFRSGESEYAINGGKCRLKDIQELIMDTGIGKDGYSMIGQGQIDRLLSSKPQDRRMIFEEAAGITKYKTRREEAEKKLQEEVSQLTRVSDILTELGAREESLAQQAETAKTYRSLKEELKLYEVSAFLGEYEQLKAQYDKAQTQLKDNQDGMAAARAERDAAKAASEAYQSTAAEARKQLALIEEELTNLKLEKEKLEGDRRVLLSRRDSQEESQKALDHRLEEIKDRIRDRNDTLTKEQEKIQELETVLREKSAFLEHFSTELKELQTAQQELESVVIQQERALNEKQAELVEVRLLLERSQMAYNQQQREAEDFQEEKERLEALLQELQHRTAARQERFDAAEAEGKALNEQRAAKAEALSGVNEKTAALRKSQEALLLQMKDLQRRREWLRSMQSEYEGFSGPVKAIMKLSGTYGTRIRGTLSDICQVEEKYVTALEMAMGAAVQNIVVEDSDTAKELVEYLRSKEIGRATFLPIDSVIGRSHTAKDDEIRRMEGVLGFADELVKADPIYTKILQRQLGNVVVTETFDQARNVSRRHGSYVRVVTLKGDIFNIGGSITGGSTKQKGSGLLSRSKEIHQVEENLRSLRSQADAIQKELSEVNDSRFELEGQVRSLDKEVAAVKETLSTCSVELKQAQFEEARTNRELKELLQAEEERLLSGDARNQEMEERKALLEQVTTQIALQEETLELAKTGAREGLEALNQKKEEEARLHVDLTSSRQQKEFMEQSATWEESEIETLHGQLDQVLLEKENLREEDSVDEESLKRLEGQLIQEDQKIIAKEQEKAAQESKVQETDAKREESLQKVEDTLSAFSQLEKEQVRLENQSQRAEQNLNELQERMWNEYEMTVGSARELSENGFDKDERLKEAAQLSKTKRHQNIIRLRNAIRDLGPVNERAIEEYKALTERIEFLTKQRDDIVESQLNLESIIERMTKRMEKQFAEGFQEIAVSFNKVFQQMFGGGQGVLKLTEGDDTLEAGVEISVQPPGKKLQSMMLLSGGEKALTAIALLFAIQELNPAPFCILDEIEAALDDANVDRFANFLQEMCHSTQFIVITHRKGTMSVADTMYGVTMEEKGVSKCISVQFSDTDELALDVTA